jgi:Nitroreductase family
MATRREVNLGILSTAAATTMAATRAFAQTPQQAIALPPPAMEGGKSLMRALQARQSIRDYADRPLSNQDLSNLLWAAWGVNRPQGDGRTAPRWRDAYLLDIYVIMADGVWLYEPKTHRLVFHMAGDLRGQTSTGQPFVAKAPLNLAYAVDFSKITGESDSDKNATAGATVGVTGQNVYLYCASAGLATVFRESVPEALAKTLQLPPGQLIQFAQTVGYPKS